MKNICCQKPSKTIQNNKVMIHNHEVSGSIPDLATKKIQARPAIAGLFCFEANIKLALCLRKNKKKAR
jgi:hypothetical protein